MTIECFNMTTAHHFDDALAAQFRLRKKVFVDRQNYAVPIWKGMEYDQFDTPAAQYFVWRDADGVARGVARWVPTSINYMLEEIWPEKITKVALPKSERVWEATRFGVDHDMPPRLRAQIAKELINAFLEYGVMMGVDQLIGMTAVAVIRNVFVRNGWDADIISPVWFEDGIEVQAGLLPVNMNVLQAVRHRTKMADVLDLRGADATPHIGREAA